MGTLFARYCSGLVLALTTAALMLPQPASGVGKQETGNGKQDRGRGGQRAVQGGTKPGARVFRVFVGGRPLGSEEVAISENASGTTITSSGTLAAPLDITLERAEAVYSPTGDPVRLSLEALVKGNKVSLTTTFSGGRAASKVTQGGKTADKTDRVSPGGLAVAQGVLFLGSYQGLARRLASAQQGASIKIYIAPVGEVDVSVNRIDKERIQTTDGTFDVKRIGITLPVQQKKPGGALTMDVWLDDKGGLLRMAVPSESLDFVREDLAAVSTRQVKVWRENDEDVRIEASGFALAATVSKPLPPEPPEPDDSEDDEEERRDPEPPDYPAVVLVAGAEAGDRDETIFGIPVLGQLANALVDAGHLVIRYDRRGVGQSGGRTEAAELEDYAEDVRAIVRYLRDRDDVDDDRIAVVGHGEGAWVAMLAGKREKRIRALVLMAAASVSGSDLLLEQQKGVLSDMRLSDEEREQKMAQQLTMQHAVLTGVDWDKVPAPVRKQSDTPSFRSMLAYTPAEVMKDVKQPILVVQGELDTEVRPHHADKLLAMARARNDGRGAADLVKLPGLNHLFVKARTGAVQEYAVLADRTISPELPRAIAAWLGKALRSS
ncbi:MAG: alpha/beta hydrolase family protein [Vicinamibacteraceae bacterium]